MIIALYVLKSRSPSQHSRMLTWFYSLLHINDCGQAMYGRVAANTPPRAEGETIPAPVTSRCPYSRSRSSASREKVGVTSDVFADVGIIHLQPKDQ
jgi:hypothetical protein